MIVAFEVMTYNRITTRLNAKGSFDAHGIPKFPRPFKVSVTHFLWPVERGSIS